MVNWITLSLVYWCAGLEAQADVSSLSTCSAVESQAGPPWRPTLYQTRLSAEDQNREWRTFFDFITERAFEMKFPLCLFFCECCRSDSSKEMVPVILLSATPMPELYIIYASKLSLNFTFAPTISLVHAHFLLKQLIERYTVVVICRSIWGLLLGHCRHPVLRWSCQGTLKIQWGKLTPTFNYRLALTASLPVYHPASPPSHQPALSFPIPTPDKSYL